MYSHQIRTESACPMPYNKNITTKHKATSHKSITCATPSLKSAKVPI